MTGTYLSQNSLRIDTILSEVISKSIPATSNEEFTAGVNRNICPSLRTIWTLPFTLDFNNYKKLFTSTVFMYIP